MQEDRGSNKRGFTGFATNRSFGIRRIVCWRFNSNSHHPEQFYAIDKRCRTCQTVGHIERACRPDLQNKAVKRYSTEGESSQSSKTRKIAAITDGNDADKTECEQKTVILESTSRANCYISDIVKTNDDQLYVIIRGENDQGSVVGYVAGVPINFLIDSGADVNTISKDNFDCLCRSDPEKTKIFNVRDGTDRSLKAYGMKHEIPVVASFVAELFISMDRPRTMEKLYVIPKARALLSRNTSLRYSVLQLGMEVPVKTNMGNDTTRLMPGDIFVLADSSVFPKFNVLPVMLTYDKGIPPSRNVFTSIPPAFRNETVKQLDELLSCGIIERVTDEMENSFCSSLLVVPKGKNDIRLVVDFRGPNKSIIRTPFPMPTLEAILAQLNGASWFTTIDLSSAFFHVELHEDCRHLTNFFAGNGTYRFKRLPFGLCNAPDIFQEILQTKVLTE
ncbi:uncharacterized protein LOC118515153 [Anopheles stephensi]|uniref:uncharacterized protein LOC118515153 n=1 Tax=Anopheles stephensi TaxID=30069 RepID=UPI00165892F4|nr:uncharacterized protein LOC118515153 [Anopheles stephensi]